MKPLSVMILVAVEVFFASGGIGAGPVLMGDPSGKVMGIQFVIPYLPFSLHDLFLVGVWLFAVYGVLPLILAAGLWMGKKWAWRGALVLGAVLVLWIVSEVVMFYSLGFTIFYPLYFGIGVLTIFLLYLKSTREYFFKD